MKIKIMLTFLIAVFSAGCGTEVGNPGTNPKVDAGKNPVPIQDQDAQDIDPSGSFFQNLNIALMSPCLNLFEIEGIAEQSLIFNKIELKFQPNENGYGVFIDTELYGSIFVADEEVDRTEDANGSDFSSETSCDTESTTEVDGTITTLNTVTISGISYDLEWVYSNEDVVLFDKIVISDGTNILTYEKQ